jgi:hypothetical protein
MLITTKTKAAPNKLIETKCSSAISFIKIVGRSNTAMTIAYHILSPQKPHVSPQSISDVTTLVAVLLKMFTKITIRKKLLTQMTKQIKKIAALPIIKYPISKSDDGLSGQISLALRKRTPDTTT